MFKYQEEARQFVPANDLCYEEIKKRIRDSEKKMTDNTSDDKYRQAVLNVSLAHLYAGHDREAWDLFKNNCRKSMSCSELKQSVEKQIASDPFYQAIQKRRTIQR